MAINIGRGVRQQSSVLKPANYGMSHIAKERLVQYVGMAVQKHIEAVEVDGTPAEIWIKQTGGRVCTCQHPQITTSNSIGSDIPQHIQQVQEENPFTFKIKSPEDIIDAGEYYDENKEPPTTIQNDGGNWTKQFDTDGSNLIDQPSNLLDEGLSSLLFGGDKSTCGVCFGTGWTDGYRLINGQRVVIDATLPNNVCMATIDTDTLPYSFKLPGDSNSYIEWLKVEVPRYFKDVEFGLFNNTIPVQGVVLIRPSNAQEYKPLSLSNLQNIHSAFMDIKIVGQFNQPLRFTHLNLVYTTSDFPKIDTPPFEKSENYQFFEALMTTNFEVPGSIPYVDRESVIGIAKEGFLWKVSSVNQVMTHERQIFKSTINARLIQRSECLYLLNGLFRPKTVYNFRGLERIQGLSNYIDRQYKNMQGV